ncbi:MAG: MOSC domain-containing protein [Gemmatimonadota bacterium]
MTHAVTNLWIYPIKSCRGIAVEQFTLDDRGPELDRRWMLVNANGEFMTQRDYPRLALIDVAIDQDEICVSAPGMSVNAFSVGAGSRATRCVVWHDAVDLLHVDQDTDRWFSDFLGTRCSLMRMPHETARLIDPNYSRQQRLVSLADAFPMLLIGTRSLALLNEKLIARGESSIPMKRFRPNVVVATARPHEEDEWKTIRIGDVECEVVKPCARCVTTTVDTRTGVPGKEPLRTLAQYRKVGSKVLFGQNVIHNETGTLRVGDGVTTSTA